MDQEKQILSKTSRRYSFDIPNNDQSGFALDSQNILEIKKIMNYCANSDMLTSRQSRESIGQLALVKRSRYFIFPRQPARFHAAKGTPLPCPQSAALTTAEMIKYSAGLQSMKITGRTPNFKGLT